MNTKLYPLKFIPIPQERVWGGHKLVNEMKKDFLPDGLPDDQIRERRQELARQSIGESWEICSLEGLSSEIANGFLAGNTLDDFVETYMGDAVGDANFLYYRGEFPLIVKLLDIRERLSVQTHPDDQTAMERHDCPGKSEFWYILDAEPDARIYMGFNKEMTPQEFYDRCLDGTVEQVLNVYTPKPGDCIYIRPGCVHAAASGVLIAEIHQNSDLSYRLYDWGREHDPRTARRMHLEDAIDVIDYRPYEKDNYYFPQVTGSRVIADTDRFIVKTVDLTGEIRVFPSLVNSFILYVCVRGEASVRMNDGSTCSLVRGETLLIPAGMEDFLLVPGNGNPYLLEVYLPQPPEEPDSYLEDAPREDSGCGCGCDHEHKHGHGQGHGHEHGHGHRHEHEHGHGHETEPGTGAF